MICEFQKRRGMKNIDNLASNECAFQNNYWMNIEAIAPDDWDMQMLNEIKTDSECHEFVSEEDAMRELGLA